MCLLKNVEKQNSRTSASSLLELSELKSEGMIHATRLECYASLVDTKEQKKRTLHSTQNYECDHSQDTDIETTHRKTTSLDQDTVLADVNIELVM